MMTSARLPLELAAPDAPPLPLPAVRNWTPSWHVFDEDSIWAINLALASGRPLLLRGEPGGGKSQLARAAAAALGWPFLSRVGNARLEPEDLLFRFDAVARLGRAQILPRDDDSIARLSPDLFLMPEVLWWALHPQSARAQFQIAAPQCGEAVCRYDDRCGPPLTDESRAVVLIDEIDKADSEVPNSLLETLGTGGFQLPFGGQAVEARPGSEPLIIITTNEDRELPPAFIRRCFVHQMDLPADPVALRDQLRPRIMAHPEVKGLSPAVLDEAIARLAEDRKLMREQDRTPPGQAELLDLLRAVVKLGSGESGQRDVLRRTKSFAFTKHRPV